MKIFDFGGTLGGVASESSQPRSIYVFPGEDPLQNLVREELLWELHAEEGPLLAVYVNARCVVIGCHQNPYAEADWPALSREGIPLLRRLSGGGAVWHDPGNVNFSWMGPRAVYHRDLVDAWVGRALQSLDIGFDISRFGDYLYRGAKFSGNAFAFRQGRALHHGTLLVDAVAADLHRFLRGYPLESCAGVRSRPSPVVNLASVVPGLTPARVIEALVWASGLEVECLPPLPGLEERMRERSSLEWVLGQTPPFKVRDRGGAIRSVIGGRWGQTYLTPQLFEEEVVLERERIPG